MTLLEKLTAYRRALYIYRAVSQNSPKLGIQEPNPKDYRLTNMNEVAAAVEVRGEVLSEKKLDLAPEKNKTIT